MTTYFDPAAAPGETPSGRVNAVLRAIAWGPAIGGVLVGVVLGSSYSFFNRLASAPPVELAASVDERPVTGTPARISIAASVVAPADRSELRDVSLRPLPAPRPEATPHPAGAFSSIATLSAPSPRLEVEMRGLKGEPAPASAGFQQADERPGRAAGRADAVAAVWGFLAVGLGGTTAAAGTPKNSFRQPR